MSAQNTHNELLNGAWFLKTQIGKESLLIHISRTLVASCFENLTLSSPIKTTFFNSQSTPSLPHTHTRARAHTHSPPSSTPRNSKSPFISRFGPSYPIIPSVIHHLDLRHFLLRRSWASLTNNHHRWQSSLIAMARVRRKSRDRHHWPVNRAALKVSEKDKQVVMMALTPVGPYPIPKS